jgi:G:T-mismatch repair DNA endonuclease (very short patch repair protein)
MKEKILVICKNCLRETFVNPSVQNRPYCNVRCWKEHKSKLTNEMFPIEDISNDYLSGKSANEIAEKYNCTPHTILKQLRKYGIKIRSNTYHLSTDKNPTKGKGHTLEAREKIRAANKKQFSNPENREKHSQLQKSVMLRGTNKLNTKPEMIVLDALTKLNINYKYQHGIIYENKIIAVVDFLIGNDIILEVQGDFWHCNPKKYKNGPIYQCQFHNLSNDKKKLDKLTKLGYKVIYLWEDDIIKDVISLLDKCNL